MSHGFTRLSITLAIRLGQNCQNKGVQYRREINKEHKDWRDGKDKENERKKSRRIRKLLAVGCGEIRNRLFGNNNSVHSAERRVSAKAMCRRNICECIFPDISDGPHVAIWIAALGRIEAVPIWHGVSRTRDHYCSTHNAHDVISREWFYKDSMIYSP